VKLNKSDIKKIILSFLGLVLFFMLFINEIPYTFNVFKLPLVLGISAGIGIIFALFFSFKVSRKAEELIEKFQIFVGSIILSMILFPLLINFFNRIHTVELMETFQFIEVQEVYGLNLKGSVRRGEIPEPTAYIISLRRKDGSIENIRSTNNITKNVASGEYFELPVQRGIFGIKYIKIE